MLVNLLSANVSFSTNAIDTSFYKENRSLSEYIGNHGFQMGISRDEAIKIYNLDYVYSGFGYSSRLLAKKNYPDKIPFLRDDPIAEGFYSASFNDWNNQETNVLFNLRKCIKIVPGVKEIDLNNVKKEFAKKFKLVSSIIPTAFIKHKGRYLQVSLWITDHNPSGLTQNNICSIAIYVEDHTYQVNAQAAKNNSINNKLEKTKNLF